MGDRRQDCSEFVGRDGPRDRIRAAFRDSLTGKARLVLVSGEAGIGKSALLAEATRDAADRDTMIVWGTCWDAERAPGYWPWAQVLRQMVNQADDELVGEMSDADRVDLARLVPELHGGVPLVTTGELDSDRARFRFFDAVARWLERVARRRPLVVVFDDLQWADSSSLALLEFVVRAHRPVPMLVLGAYRHDELRDDVAETLASVGGRAERVRLRGLSASEVRELLARRAGEDLADRWSDDVHSRTGGHPFLVRELSHALATQEASDIVPDAAHDLIAGRIGRISPDCRRLLDAAAVAGNEILPDVLGDMLNIGPSAVASQLSDAVRAGVLVAGDSPGRARFAHDLYRETIYADLPTPTRLALHQQIGAGLERRLARGGSVFAGDVARHFAAAAAVDGPDRAIRWALEAAAADRTGLAFTEAAAQLARVRTALDDAGVAVPADMLVDLLVAQADAESRAGDPSRARQLLRDAHTHAVRLADPERLAAVALGLQGLGARFAMPRDEVVALLEEARRAVEGRAPAVEAQVTASLARELHHSVPKDRARARPLSEHAVAIARDLGDPATLAACLLARHDVLWTPGAGAERVEVPREIVALARRVGDDERQSEGHLLTANALLESGSPAFRTELDAFLRLEDRFGQPRHDYFALTRRAAMALLDGSLDEGEHLIHTAATLGERIGEPDTGNVRMSQLLEVARARGEPGQLRATAEMAVGWWVGVPSHAHAVAAGLFAEAGDFDAARRALDTVVGLGTWREDRSYLWSVFVGGLTVAAARLGDLDLSRELFEEPSSASWAATPTGPASPPKHSARPTRRATYCSAHSPSINVSGRAHGKQRPAPNWPSLAPTASSIATAPPRSPLSWGWWASPIESTATHALPALVRSMQCVAATGTSGTSRTVADRRTSAMPKGFAIWLFCSSTPVRTSTSSNSQEARSGDVTAPALCSTLGRGPSSGAAFAISTKTSPKPKPITISVGSSESRPSAKRFSPSCAAPLDTQARTAASARAPSNGLAKQ